MSWRVGYDDGSGEDCIVADDRAVAAVRWGCSCCKDTSPLKPDEIKRAHLIAAAPDLLAALKLALPYARKVAGTKPFEMNRMQRQRQACADVRAIEAAIAKAEAA